MGAIFVEKFPPRANIKNLKSKNPNISKRNSSSALQKSNKSITTQSPKNISSIMSTKRKIEDEESEEDEDEDGVGGDEGEEEEDLEGEEDEEGGEEEDGEEEEDDE